MAKRQSGDRAATADQRIGDRAWYERGYESALWAVVIDCLRFKRPLPDWAESALVKYARERIGEIGYRGRTGRPTDAARDHYIYWSVEELRAGSVFAPRKLKRNEALEVMVEVLSHGGDNLDFETVLKAYKRGKKLRPGEDFYANRYLEAQDGRDILLAFDIASKKYPSPKR